MESEDLGEQFARERTNTLVNYSMAQAKLGGTDPLEELSGLIDEGQPKSFYDDLLISIDADLLGSTVEFDAAIGTLTLRNLQT